ncbi:MAG TPA: hypothetical protein VLF90_02020 [Patescibacteria group bacterium]|nr:hypothetical protein [Patescibacteria group bacterium]
MSKIGIFSGAFDPVHAGHIAFALAAMQEAGLNQVYFLVEPKPRQKIGVTHLAHRHAMIKLATQPYPGLKLLDLPDKQFSVAKTLPRLHQRFPVDELYFLAGSDLLEHMAKWPLINRLLFDMGLIIGFRSSNVVKTPQQLVGMLPVPAKELHVLPSPMPTVSSGLIRAAVAQGMPCEGLLASIQPYIASHWLYSSPSSSVSVS